MPLCTVNPADIIPNRWRDLNLYPIDAEQVARLSESIEQIGVFGAIPGRPAPDDKVEQGCHHHVVEAARRCGVASVVMDVRERSDEEMLRLMIVENSTQRGHNPASTMDSVNAVVRRIAWKKFASKIFEASGIGQIEGLPPGDEWEIGEPAIAEIAKGLSLGEIRVALGALKTSGHYSAAVADAIAEGQRRAQERIERLERERLEAEEAARAAEEEAERQRLDAEAEALRTEEEEAIADLEAIEKAAEQETEREVTFDARVANLFKNPSQLDTFRKLVTTEDRAKYVPYEDQYQCALDIIEAARTWGKDRENGQVTSDIIREYFRNLLLNNGVFIMPTRAPKAEPPSDFAQAEKAILDAEADLMEATGMMARAIRAGAQVPALFHQFINTREATFEDIIRELRTAAGIKPGAISRTIEGSAEVIDVTEPLRPQQQLSLRRP